MLDRSFVERPLLNNEEGFLFRDEKPERAEILKPESVRNETALAESSEDHQNNSLSNSNHRSDPPEVFITPLKSGRLNHSSQDDEDDKEDFDSSKLVADVKDDKAYWSSDELLVRTIWRRWDFLKREKKSLEKRFKAP